MKNYKNFFLSTALATVVSLLPAHVFSAPASVSNSIEGEESGFFLAAKWNLNLGGGGKFSSLKKGDVKYQIFGKLKDESQFSVPGGYEKGDYSPEYNVSWKGGGLQLGYLMSGSDESGLRIQADGDYSAIDVKGYDKDDKDGKYTYFAGVAEDAAAGTNADTIFRNKGYSAVSAALDLCYDMVPEGFPVAPFLCVGGGVSRVAIADLKNKEDKDAVFYKPMVQGKIGFSYVFTPQFHAFASGRVRSGVGASEFADLKNAAAADKAIYSYNQSLISYGVEAGLRLVF